MNQVATKTDNPLVKLHEQLEQRTSQFQAALPAHIPAERFKRVLMTAVQNTPALLTADRPTLFTSAMKAAQDGLLPDGREGAMVIYKTKVKINNTDRWIEAVQWIPMIGGIRKKVRNSKEIATWDVKAVYERDEFVYEQGLDLILKHKPFLEGNPGALRLCYSVARLKTGEVSVEVMTKWEIDRIRNMSKSKDKGPWVDHYDEMAKKTVARRHSKVLPMSTDLDDLIRRDDDLYDMAGASDREQATRRPQLSDFSDVESSTPSESKDGQGEAQPEAEPEQEPEQQPAHDPETGEIADEDEPDEYGPADAMNDGTSAFGAGKSLNSFPREWEQLGRTSLIDAFKQGWRDAEAEAVAKQTKRK